MPETAELSIGDDIVDLGLREPALHPRYLTRVFTEAEREAIGADRALLWAHWAAKEAAFKAVKRLRPEVSFSHKAFRVDLIASRVRYEGASLPCRVTITDAYAFAACAFGFEEFPDGCIRSWISDLASTDGSHLGSDPSIAVRALAVVRVSEALNVDPGSIEISASRIPALIAGGVQSPHLISFSHHGRFVSCTLLLVPQPPVRGAGN